MGGQTISTSDTRIPALKLQSSAYGVTVPIIAGRTRASGNLAWYGGFKATPHTKTQGGKGGVKVQSTTYTYSASVIMGLCQGVFGGSAVTDVGQVWRGKQRFATDALARLGLSLKTGAVGQAAWSALASFPGRDISYSGLAYVAGQDYDLGTGAQVENHGIEVVAPLAYHLGPSIPDVDPALFVRELLLDPMGGASMPAGLLASWSQWSDWCVAAGLLISPCLDTQQSAADIVRHAAELTNAGPVWTDGALKIVPYADEAATGNGRTYTPNATPVYALDDDAYIVEPGEPPVRQRLKTPADRWNHIRVEFRNRAAEYNRQIAEAKDQADIDVNGIRSRDIIRAHWICDAAAADRAAQIALQRAQAVCAEYECTLPWHFALLEPTDLITLRDDVLQLDALPARVIAIEEQEDGELRVIAEDYPPGTANPALFATQVVDGYSHQYNADPGDVDAPVIFEAPASLAETGLEVYAAVRGASTLWGGCQVWVSLDGTSYRQAGVVYGASRYGALVAGVGSSAQVDGLGTEQLLSGSAADAAALETLCFIGGSSPEYLAYQTATLTGPGAYTLSTLTRAVYGTSASVHASSDPFVRVDDRIAKSGPLDPSMVGKTLWFKFCSFNITGGGQQGLADVPAYSYVVTGALAALEPAGATRTWRQPAAPARPRVGDIWIDTDDGNRVRRWTGSAWADGAVGTGGIQAGAVTEGDVTTTSTTVGGDPGGPAVAVSPSFFLGPAFTGGGVVLEVGDQIDISVAGEYRVGLAFTTALLSVEVWLTRSDAPSGGTTVEWGRRRAYTIVPAGLVAAVPIEIAGQDEPGAGDWHYACQYRVTSLDASGSPTSSQLDYEADADWRYVIRKR